MRYKNNVGPQVRRRRYALGWSQSDLATKLQLAALVRRRQNDAVFSGSAARAGAGAFPAENARKSHPRLHGETGDHAVLTSMMCLITTRSARTFLYAIPIRELKQAAYRSQSQLKLNSPETS